MSGPNPPGPESLGDDPEEEILPAHSSDEPDEKSVDEPIDEPAELPTKDVQAYSAPESEQFRSSPYIPADVSLYDYDAYEADGEGTGTRATPKWPWVVGVAAILAAVALVTSVSLVVTRTSNVAAPPSTTTSKAPPVQDESTTPKPPPPPPPTETVTVTSEPPPPPPPVTEPPPPPPQPPPVTEPPPPPPAPAPAPSSSAAPPPAPPTSTAPAAPRQVTYTVTGTKAPGDIISITFTDASGRSRTQRNVYIPWSFTLTPISTADVGSVQASSFFRVSRLNCSITASDGTVLSQQQDNAPMTSC
jgi:cell division septation protein DedD